MARLRQRSVMPTPGDANTRLRQKWIVAGSDGARRQLRDGAALISILI
jgi:hypothetical protein